MVKVLFLEKSGLATTYSMVSSELGDYKTLSNLKGYFESDNAENRAFITNTLVYSDLRSLTETTGQHIVAPAGLAPIYWTSAVPFNINVGGYTNCSAVLAGDWTNVYLGIRTNPTVLLAKERYIEFLQYSFIAFARFDVQCVRSGALARIIAVKRASGAKT